jgi:hypothetical protein
VAELRAAMPRSVKLHYAMKANPMPAVVVFMAGLVGVFGGGAGAVAAALARTGRAAPAGPGRRGGDGRWQRAEFELTGGEPRRCDPLAPALTEALLGLLGVGLVDSLFDMPRVAWLGLWLPVVALTLLAPASALSARVCGQRPGMRPPAG